MPLVPNRFLVRLLYGSPFVKDMPRDDEESLIELPDAARLDAFADLDVAPQFADVRLGWNETGLGLTVEVKGKENPPIGDVAAAAVGWDHFVGRHARRPDRAPGDANLPSIPLPGRGQWVGEG